MNIIANWMDIAKWLDIYIADGLIICWILETRRFNGTVLFCSSQGEDKTLIYICMIDIVKSLTVKKISSANTFPDGETNRRGTDYDRQTMLGPLSKRRVNHLVADSLLLVISCRLLVYRLPVGERGNARPRVADRRLPTVYPRLLPLPMVQVNARRLENRRLFLRSL